MKELSNILTFYAVSPVHAGAESSTGAVDNPIQREVHTNYPHVQANGVKGAMRDFFRQQNKDKELESLIFGDEKYEDPEEENEDKKQKSCPGAIAISDAKLFAMPVRSNIAPFVWVTCPTIFKRLNTDLQLCGIERIDVSEITGDNSILINWETGASQIILEDIIVNKGPKVDYPEIKEYFQEADKLLFVSDETFKYVVDNCTDIQTQIKIDEDKGTAADGALRYSEYLPPDSILYSVVYYGDAVFKKSSMEDLKMKNIKSLIENTFNSFMQIGGDKTLGRGIAKLKWINNSEDKNE